MPIIDLLDCYEESEREALTTLAEILNGEIIPTGGGFVAVRYGDHYLRERTPENEGDPFEAWYLATVDDDGLWIATYEQTGEDGQREWVEAKLPLHWLSNADATRDAFRTAGYAAAQGPLL